MIHESFPGGESSASDGQTILAYSPKAYTGGGPKLNIPQLRGVQPQAALPNGHGGRRPYSTDGEPTAEPEPAPVPEPGQVPLPNVKQEARRPSKDKAASSSSPFVPNGTAAPLPLGPASAAPVTLNGASAPPMQGRAAPAPLTLNGSAAPLTLGPAPVRHGSPQALAPVPEKAPANFAPPLLQASDPFANMETLQSDPFANQPFDTVDYEEATKKQKQSAKQLVKDFVKTMVRGRQLAAVLPSGEVRACFCALNRGLDKLQIRAAEKDRHGRTVPLQNIAEIVVGSDKSASAATEGLETPLDNLSVTLVLETDECITFRLEDVESRDKLAACLTMFSGQARTAKRGG